MIFIYKITGVKFRMQLCKYHHMTLAANDATAYTLCLGPHRKLILTVTVILLKISQINLKIVYIQKIEKDAFRSKLPLGPFLRDAARSYIKGHYI